MENKPKPQRRSPRILWRTPVLINWATQEGGQLRERAETEIVNAHGGLLRLATQLPCGQRVDLLDPNSGDICSARVVWSRQEEKNLARAGVELIPPSETFWGIRIPILQFS